MHVRNSFVLPTGVLDHKKQYSILFVKIVWVRNTKLYCITFDPQYTLHMEGKYLKPFK